MTKLVKNFEEKLILNFTEKKKLFNQFSDRTLG